MDLNRIAFTGYAGSGKDEAAKPLMAAGYSRKCFGDIIKRQLDGLVRLHFGFSAFTEVREEKAKIRRILEAWGEDNYTKIFEEFFAALPHRCVNTRLVRPPEGERWNQENGMIFEIVRPGLQPATDWEFQQLQALKPFIFSRIYNDGTLEDLYAKIRDIFGPL